MHLAVMRNPILLAFLRALRPGLICAGVVFGAETGAVVSDEGDEPVILQKVDPSIFEVLFTNPPFTRSVDPSDSIILTGLASMSGEVVATVLDTETMRSQVVSKMPNAKGWQLVEVGGDEAAARTWRAQIRIEGGEVISVRYQKPPTKVPRAISPSAGGGGSGSTGRAPTLSSGDLAEAKKAAVDYKAGFSSDGYPDKPPAEMVAKLSRLSVAQREGINQQMLGYRNQGLGLDERRKIYERLVEREGGR